MNSNQDKILSAVLNLTLILTLILLGLALISATKRFYGFSNEITLIILLILPLIIYVVLAGKLQELRTPGGLELKFYEAASTPLSLSSGYNPISPETLQRVDKGEAFDLGQLGSRINPVDPVILEINITHRNFELNVMRYFARTLFEQSEFKFVLIIDNENRFLYFISSRDFFNILRGEKLANLFIQLLNDSNNESELKKFAGVYDDALKESSSNIDALKKMFEKKLDSYLVSDNDHHIVGIVMRDQILSKLLINSFS